MKFRSCISASLFALSAQAAIAQPVSLREAVTLALAHDPTIEKAQAGVERLGVNALRYGALEPKC